MQTLTAVVRTFVQWGLAKIMASAFGVGVVTFLAEELGFTITEDQRAWIVNGTTALLMGGVVFLVNKFGKRFAIINKIVSLGLSRTGPAYVPNAADAVVSTAKEGETDTVDTITTIDVPPPGPNE